MQSTRYRTVAYKNIEVCYLSHLEGGGMGFGQTYVPVVNELFGKVGRVYEFCAGPGFIGFALLAHGLCDSVCLSDINPEAVEAAKETVRRNNLEDRVSVYLSDALEGIPVEEKWDLVVSNPPHFRNQFLDSLRHYDANWDCHRKFYAGVGRHLNPSASLLIQENYEGSNEEDFTAMVNDGGLQVSASLMYRATVTHGYFDSYYFLWSRLKEEVFDKPLPTGRTFSYLSPALTIVPVSLSLSRAPEIELNAYTRYQLKISNHLARDTTLLVYAVRHRVRKRFLRSVCAIAKDECITTFPFQMFPGRYEVRDAGSRSPLLVICVA